MQQQRYSSVAAEADTADGEVESMVDDAESASGSSGSDAEPEASRKPPRPTRTARPRAVPPEAHAARTEPEAPPLRVTDETWITRDRREAHGHEVITSI